MQSNFNALFLLCQETILLFVLAEYKPQIITLTSFILLQTQALMTDYNYTISQHNCKIKSIPLTVAQRPSAFSPPEDQE